MSKTLISDIKVNSRWRVRLEFKAADCWLGVYWVNHGGFWDVWVCLLPCLPIHFYSMEKD